MGAAGAREDGMLELWLSGQVGVPDWVGGPGLQRGFLCSEASLCRFGMLLLVPLELTRPQRANQGLFAKNLWSADCAHGSILEGHDAWLWMVGNSYVLLCNEACAVGQGQQTTAHMPNPAATVSVNKVLTITAVCIHVCNI